MELFPRDLFFLGFISHATDVQLKNTLKCLTRGQYAILKNMAQQIVEDEIPLSPMEFQMLRRYGQFIEKLADVSRIRPRELTLKKHVIVKLAEITTHYYETQSKSCSVVERRLGSGGKRRKCQTCERDNYSKKHAEAKETISLKKSEPEMEQQNQEDDGEGRHEGVEQLSVGSPSTSTSTTSLDSSSDED